MVNEGETFTACRGAEWLVSGQLEIVAQAVYRAGGADIQVYSDRTGMQVDLDLRGSEADVVERYAEPGREQGRPKLGVVAREVTLLPRHWDWLSGQQSSASAALRRLVDAAIRSGEGSRESGRDAAYRFMMSTSGDRPGFEEASRALFAGDAKKFSAETRGWPADIRNHIEKLAGPALGTGD